MLLDDKKGIEGKQVNLTVCGKDPCRRRLWRTVSPGKDPTLEHGDSVRKEQWRWRVVTCPQPSIPLHHWGGGRIVGSEVEEKRGLSFYSSRSCSGTNWQEVKLVFPKQSPFCLWQQLASGLLVLDSTHELFLCVYSPCPAEEAEWGCSSGHQPRLSHLTLFVIIGTGKSRKDPHKVPDKAQHNRWPSARTGSANRSRQWHCS